MPDSRPRIRLGFQAKVLIPVVALLVLVPALTLLIVTRHIGAQMETEASRTLTTADGVFRQSLAIRQRSLVSRFRNVVNEPRFRAVAGLGDVKTMTAFLKEALADLGEETDVLLFADGNGDPAGAAARAASAPLELYSRSTRDITLRALEGESTSGRITFNHRTYDVVAVPVVAADRRSLRGVLTVLVRFGEQAVRELKSLTHTEIAIVAGGQVTTATLPQVETATALADAIGLDARNGVGREMIPVVVEGEHFLALGSELRSEGAGTGLRYLLLSSYEDRVRALKETRVQLIGLGLVGVLSATLVVSVLIRRITHPLRLLRDGAEAVGRGDFSVRIREISRDECGDLAHAFNRMIGNLDSSRTELEHTVATLRTTDAQLRASREELRLMIESARDHMILAFDPAGYVVSWNPAAGRLLGYTAEEAHGMVYGLLFSDEDRAAGVPEQVLRSALSEGRHAFEGWRIRRDGTKFWADVTVSRLPDNASQGRGGFVEIARDITARKEAELALRQARDAAEAASRAKSEFLANMSHELRTPMNAIIGMASLLRDRPSSSEEREGAQTIHVSASNLLGLIDDILDVSKMESGRIQLAPHACDIIACIEGVVEPFLERCTAKNVELRGVVSQGVPASVLVDERRLRQALSALLANAVKFTERGHVTLSVARVTSAEATRLEFEVADTGIGIAPEQRERLFKLFSQVESSATRRFGGLGLGLALCHQIVALMGGAIRVESTPGRGSRFTISVPLETPLEPAKVAPKSAGSPTPRRPLRILMVEDNPVNSRVAMLVLKRLGYGADCVENGQLALERLQNETYDLVFMDLQMPVMDGLTAVRHFRERVDASQAPYICALTANALPTDRQACLDVGMHQFVAKPVQLEKIAEVIEQAGAWLERCASGSPLH